MHLQDALPDELREMNLLYVDYLQPLAIEGIPTQRA
jgi:hypothetical protein